MLKGRLADDVPSKMTQGSEQRITVRIAANTSQDLTRGLAASNPAHTEDIQVAPYMTVKLIGDAEAFQITPFTPEEQFIATDTYTQWQYSVKPLEAGTKELDLLVGVRVKEPGSSQESRFYPTYERKVEVTVDRAYEVKHFLGKKWQWIVGGILLPIFLLWLGKKFKSDDKPEVGKESEKEEKKDAVKPADNAKASDDDDGLE
jgi:hypothetical protein